MKNTVLANDRLVEKIGILQDRIDLLERTVATQKQTENDLETSEKNLSSILEKNADGIIIVDMHGAVLYVNPAAEQLFGRSREKFLSYPFGFPVSVDNAEDTLVIVKGDTFCEAEFRVVSVNWNKKPALQLSVRDITDRKHTEEALRTSEMRFKTLTESAPVGIFGTDVFGLTNYVNRRWCEISRMGSEEALGNGWLSAVHPDDRSLLTETWNQASLTQTSSSSEYRFLHRDGSISWVNGLAIPQKDQTGNVIGYIGTITDITESKQTEEKLIESEAYYRTLIDISPDGIITADVEGKVTYGSKKAYEIFEVSPDNGLIGTSVLNWLDPEFHQPILERFKDILAGNVHPVTGEYKLLKHDRSVFWAELSSCPITDAKGNTSGLLIVCRDISGRKKAEEELIKARDKAEEGDRLKTAFLHNISHETRTPMNAIIGFSALLGEPDLTRETQKSYIEIITQSSYHLLDVLNDIIEISNIEAGILKIKKNEINLNALLIKLYKQFNTQAEEKGIELKLSTVLSDKEANIHADNGKLIQILSNLLSNALKFTFNGKIDFGYFRENGDLEFFVKDTGIGIPEDQHQKIFNRFYQVMHSDTKLYEGTGLGLSISKEYIELMKGTIWLTSKPGKGSVFYFKIPYEGVNKQKLLYHPQTVITKPETVDTKSLLIAEDDESNFYLIKELLSELNIRIIRAFNGIEAVNICKSGREVDLVLMDIKMPIMDGYTAIKKILEHTPGMKIIAQTAYDADEAKSMDAGCVGFISKPFIKKHFIKLVNDFL